MFKFLARLFGRKPSEVAPAEKPEMPRIVSKAPAPIHRDNSPRTTTARDRSEVHPEISSPLSPPHHVGLAMYSSSDDSLSRSHCGGFSSGDSYGISSGCSTSDGDSTGSGGSD